jgi:hypothetical protein
MGVMGFGFVVTNQGVLKMADNGIVNKLSNHSVDETTERLKTILHAKGVTLFALVDHSGEAEKAGMKMPPTKLLIFGDPKAGTPLMLAAPQQRDRPAVEDPRLGGRGSKSVDFL